MNCIRLCHLTILALVAVAPTIPSAEACCKGGGPAMGPAPSGGGVGGSVPRVNVPNAGKVDIPRPEGGREKVSRKDWQAKIDTLFKEKKKRAEDKGIKVSDIELMKWVKARIDKDYEVEVKTAATPSPVAPPPSVAPPPPPVDPAIAASRSYDQADWNWMNRHIQQLPDGTWGLASDWNAKLAADYKARTGVDLNAAWDDAQLRKDLEMNGTFRETPMPPKEPYKGQGSPDDPRPVKPAGYVPP